MENKNQRNPRSVHFTVEGQTPRRSRQVRSGEVLDVYPTLAAAVGRPVPFALDESICFLLAKPVQPYARFHLYAL